MIQDSDTSGKLSTPSQGTILFIRFGSLGDIVLTLPILGLVHDAFPRAAIHYVLKEQYRDILLDNPLIDRVHCLPAVSGGEKPFQKLLTELRRCNFDAIIDLHANIRSRILSLLCRSNRVLRYEKGALQRRLFVRTGLRIGRFPHTVERYQHALAPLITLPETIKNPSLPLSVEERQRASENRLLILHGVHHPVLAISPGARHATKRWLTEGFVEVGRDFLAQHSAASIILFGDGSERTLCEHISQSIGQRCVSTAGELSIRESAALLSTCDLLLTNDSGLMHLAAAVQVPLVALFGPTSRELGFFPLGESASTVLEVPLLCRPCSLHGGKVCPLGTHDCMKKITVERVITAIEEKLSTPD